MSANTINKNKPNGQDRAGYIFSEDEHQCDGEQPDNSRFNSVIFF